MLLAHCACVNVCLSLLRGLKLEGPKLWFTYLVGKKHVSDEQFLNITCN